MVNIGIQGQLSSGKTLMALGWIEEIWKYYPKKEIISNVHLSIDHQYFTAEDFFNFYNTVIKYNENKRDYLINKLFFNKIWLADELVNFANARAFNSKENKAFTRMLTMLGKLDCDIIYTSQIAESQVDKILRELSQITCLCERYSIEGEPIFFGPRKMPNIKIHVVMHINLGFHGEKEIEFFFYPQRFYKMYNTRQLVLYEK